jgi:DNA polymerase III subunit alpha
MTMDDRPFVHLHCHTHYSLLDGANRIPELVAHVKSQGMNAVAITDHGNLFGAIEFYRECTEAGINPIVGYEAYVAPVRRTDREAKRRGDAGFHLTLLAKNRAGFKNLVKMASLAYTEGFHYVPRIDKELLEAHHEGLICLSGCASSEFSEFILGDDLAKAKELAVWFHRLFGNDFYVEVQNNGLKIQQACAEGATDVANQLGLPLVATSDAHYLHREDAPAHDVLLCINTRKLYDDTNRMRYGDGDGKMVDQFYVCGPDEMYQRFRGREEAVKRSQEIADKCELKIDLKQRYFPVFTTPDRKTPEDYLRELCTAGLHERYGDASAEIQEQARLRLEHELGIICRMGFAGYFLIVWDFVRFALSKGIPAGARGSACGAIVSYALKLSNVCPLEFGLLFERFLDPNRSEAPDIDIDFCQDRREEVIAYVREKYGANSVAQIATFGTMAAKAAIKDVGRVLNVPLERVNRLTAMVPKVLNISLEDSLKQSTDLRREYDSDPDVHRLIDIAMKLEGTNRNVGTHAAGVVIANGDITDYVPVQRVQRRESGEGEPITTTQWGMGDLEKVGLLKMDFLGLRTLTVVDNTLKLIEKTRGIRVDIEKLDVNDAATYKLLQRGEARGVFQLESDGIRELLKRMKPDNIRDLIATNALYRPGPLGGGMVDAYVNRKHGREQATYAHPSLKEILGETHGVMCYQEQVMQILNQLGGIELSSAYACIKAISKKKHDIIDARRVDFIKGAQERGVSETTAREIFDLICFFGGYGFNKSHSAAYAKLGFQTAYLKTHFTAEFMAALLTSETDDSNKRDIMVEHIEDARRLGVEVLPPSIQEGEANFTVKDGKIVFGLLAIKGVGRGAVDSIVRARAAGPFRDFYDFCERADHKAMPRLALERLIKVGAFDCMGVRRRQLMEAMPRAIAAVEEAQRDRRLGQLNLFEALDGDNGADTAQENLPDVPEWPAVEKLKFEKEALDFYITSHPLTQFRDLIERFAAHRVDSLPSCDQNQEVFLGGILTQVRFQNTKKARNGNSRFARCKFEDFSGVVECLIWPDDLIKHKDLVVDDQVCFVSGAVDKSREQLIVQMTRVLTLEQGQLERTTGLVVSLEVSDESERDSRLVEALAAALKRAPRGGCPVFLYVRDGAGRWLRLKAGDEFKVNPATLVKADLEAIVGAGRVEFSRQGSGNGRSH